MANGDGIYYCIKKGDTLSKLAKKYGIAGWRTIYNHDNNEDFRALRPNPNQIEEHDVVWLPSANANKSLTSSGKRTWYLASKQRKIQAIKIQNITFEADHDILLDNDADWTKNGYRFAKPEWTSARSFPVTYTMGTTVNIKIEVSVCPCNADEIGVEISGLGANEHFSFRANSDLKGGKWNVSFPACDALPKNISVITDEYLTWDFIVDKIGLPVIPTGKHKIYIIMEQPIDDNNEEDGPTVKRMEKAVEWVGRLHTIDPGKIIEKLFRRFPNYILDFKMLPDDQKAYLNSNPALKKKLTDLNWPSYLDNNAGGAWPLSEYYKYGGECQAIVRLIRGIKNQIGCPGIAEVKYLNADASNPYEAVIKDEGSRCSGPDPDMAYALVDAPVEVGKMYLDDGSVGWNSFEAFLKFTYHKLIDDLPSDETTVAWFGGGVGKLGEVDESDPATKKEFEDGMLQVFWGLVEFKRSYTEGSMIRRVSKIWRYRR